MGVDALPAPRMPSAYGLSMSPPLILKALLYQERSLEGSDLEELGVDDQAALDRSSLHILSLESYQ